MNREEVVPNGSVRIRVVEYLDADYSMHGETKWDSYPYYAAFRVWNVSIRFPDSEQDKRRIDKRFDTWDGSLESEERKACENFVLEEGLKLEEKGYKVILEFVQEGDSKK